MAYFWNDDKSRKEYWAALGQFIQAFSQVEEVLICILQQKAATSNQISRALFSGVRADAAMQNISRILEALKAPKEEKEEIQAIFTQLGGINLIRNDIVHYGTKDHGPGSDFITTNKRVALNRARLRTTLVSAKILETLSDDLETIIARLYLYYAIGVPSEAMARETFLPIAQRPWRYKLAGQASPGGKRQPKSQKKKRQPRPSQQ